MFGMTLGEKNKAYLVEQRGSSIFFSLSVKSCVWQVLMSIGFKPCRFATLSVHFSSCSDLAIFEEALYWRDGKLQGTNGKGNIFLENLRRSLSLGPYACQNWAVIKTFVTFHTGQLIGILRMTYDTYAIGLYNPQPTFRTLLNYHLL